MNLYLGVTEPSWFNFLASKQPDEVNFWQPVGTPSFKVLRQGELFLFKLKSPHNAIAGGGYFVRHLHFPLTVIWEIFHELNGVSDLPAFKKLINAYRHSAEPNPDISCIILTQPFFFDRAQWIPQPVSWETSTGQGKSYSTQEHDGAAIYAALQTRLQSVAGVRPRDVSTEDERFRYGQANMYLGQGAFRALVSEAYQYRCAMTGDSLLPVLEATHIQPISANGAHWVQNGVLLRADLHNLFDQGYMTITPDYHIEVSPRLKTEVGLESGYYALHGNKIRLPADLLEAPDRRFLEWHNQNIYVG